MHFVFYPKHEFGCHHVAHCPHLGGASLGWLVHATDEQTEWTDSLLRQIDGLRSESAAKSDKIAELTARNIKGVRTIFLLQARLETANLSPCLAPCDRLTMDWCIM